jgi:hypothetical protein
VTTDSWLPALVPVDWNDYPGTIDRAYAVFVRDFGDEKTRPTFRGRRLGHKFHKPFDGKSATFWHMVTDGDIEEKRTPVRERLERVGWPRALILNVDNDARVRCWCAVKKGEQRWHLALTDYSYLVVLADRGEYLLPWTAFAVDGEHQRVKLKREHDAWLAEQKQKS